MLAGQLTASVVSLAEAQAYVRVETGEEEAILAGLIRTASAASSLPAASSCRAILPRRFRQAAIGNGWQ